jgi:RNA polymerase sigma-70 factor (ECF subfamily)
VDGGARGGSNGGTVTDSETVWQRLRGDLLAYFRRRGCDPHRAEDLLQDTLTRVHDGLPSLRSDASLGAWVFRIARSVLVDDLRATRPGTAIDTDSLPAPSAAEPNLNRDVEGWLRAMLTTLPPEYAAAVELAEVDGLPQQAIADRLGLSLSGAKSRVQRGRAQLRARLLACCHLEFDRRGNVVGYEKHGTCSSCDEGPS